MTTYTIVLKPKPAYPNLVYKSITVIAECASEKVAMAFAEAIISDLEFGRAVMVDSIHENA